MESQQGTLQSLQVELAATLHKKKQQQEKRDGKRVRGTGAPSARAELRKLKQLLEMTLR